VVAKRLKHSPFAKDGMEKKTQKKGHRAARPSARKAKSKKSARGEARHLVHKASNKKAGHPKASHRQKGAQKMRPRHRADGKKAPAARNQKINRHPASHSNKAAGRHSVSPPPPVQQPVVRENEIAILVLLRHGQSQWNLENRFTGWIDVPLSFAGEQEAHAAGMRIAGMGVRFNRAYTSVLLRATQTLKLVLDDINQTGVPTVQDAALNERKYGKLQGMNKDEARKKFGEEQVHLWRRSYDVRPPGGESLEDTCARTLPFFDKRIMTDLQWGRHVLVSAHGNSLRSIVMELDGLTPDQVVSLEIPTGVPYVYEFDKKMNIIGKRILL
jgi:2,3-bisphosphoglycerate-dependent phosphoglycerate mutase